MSKISGSPEGTPIWGDKKNIQETPSSKKFQIPARSVNSTTSLAFPFPEKGHVKEWLIQFKGWAQLILLTINLDAQIETYIKRGITATSHFAEFCNALWPSKSVMDLIKNEAGIDLTHILDRIQNDWDNLYEDHWSSAPTKTDIEALIALIDKASLA